MLQTMRASAKYIFWFILISFVLGFLLAETSGLLGLGAVQPTDAIAEVNGEDITVAEYDQRVQAQVTQVQESGRTLSEDDIRDIREGVFNQMVTDLLMRQEFNRRGIGVTDDEIRAFAQRAPPPFLVQNPEMQTDGQFDMSKYQRFLASSQARQSGLLQYLEQYYRTEIPKAKLVEQITSAVYVSDEELWRTWRDFNDSVVVSFVAFRAPPATTADKTIPEADLRRYFERNKERMRRPGRALLSVLEIRRDVSAADSAAVRARAERLRQEIVGGAKFEDVARRESSDSVSAKEGGSRGRGAKGRFDAPFEAAAYALQPGQVSEPVLTQFGYHLIRVDERKGDTLSLRHILLPIQPSDSSAVRTDRRADELSRLTAGVTDQPARFDSAARKLGLQRQVVVAIEGQPAMHAGRVVPSVSAWAFGGAKPGETSDLFDSEASYVVARLDSLRDGSDGDFDAVKEEIRLELTRQRLVEKLVPQAEQLARAAASSTLDQAASTHKQRVEIAGPFTRASGAPGLGRLNEAVGAAFGLPIGAVSAPIKTEEGVFVMRVDRRTEADRKLWEGRRQAIRRQHLEQLREQRVQQYLQELRRSANVEDHRKDINALARRADG